MKRILRSFALVTVSSAIMGVITYGVSYYLGVYLDTRDTFNQLIQVGVSIAVGLMVYAGAVFMCRLEETELIAGMIKRKLKKA